MNKREAIKAERDFLWAFIYGECASWLKKHKKPYPKTTLMDSAMWCTVLKKLAIRNLERGSKHA